MLNDVLKYSDTLEQPCKCGNLVKEKNANRSHWYDRRYTFDCTFCTKIPKERIFDQNIQLPIGHFFKHFFKPSL